MEPDRVGGYARPTTPWIEGFVQRGGPRVMFTCDGLAPGTWTLPTHASYFTGQWPTEHQLLLKSRPLKDEVETLAEHFAARGYQTAIVTANPTLSPSSNILQGFRVVERGDGGERYRGKAFRARLLAALERLDVDRPLFLVVNLFDAHDPYPEIPAGIGWLAPRPAQHLVVDVHRPASLPIRFMRGELPEEDASAWLADLNDTYDYGVSLADQNVKAVWHTLRDRGFTAHGVRLVLTSDHGEHFGEHGMVRHNGVPYQPVARVPLLFHDDTLAEHPRLEGPVSTMLVYHLLRHGRLPDPMPLPIAVSIDDIHGEPWRDPGVAIWGPDGRKLVWRPEGIALFDLATDPLEQRPQSADGHPLVARLEEEVSALMRAQEAIRARGRDARMVRELEGLGYVE